MKSKIPSILPALAVVLLLVMSGCLDEKRQVVHLTGVLAQEDVDTVILYRSLDRYGYRSWLTALDTAIISSGGEFSFTHAATEPDFYQVVGPRGYPLFNDVYLEPGDSLHVDVPVRSDTTRNNYTGSRAGAYAVHHKLDSLWRNDTIFRKDYYDVALMQIDSAWEFLEEKSQKRLMVVEDHFRGHPEWEVIRKKSLEDQAYRNILGFFNYLYYHNYYSNDTFLYLIPEREYYTFVDTLDLKDTPDHYSSEYQSFLSMFIQDRVERDNAELSDSLKYANMMPLQMEAAIQYLEGEARDQAFLAISSDFSTFLWSEDFFAQLDSMDSYFAANHASAIHYEMFKHARMPFDALRPGSPAPALALPDVNGDTVRLSDFKGKVVYMDFWGTWCWPCLKELPHSLELQETFRDQPVEFVYVGLQSGDDQVTEWREFVTGKRSFEYAPFLEQRVYPGTHLLSDGQFNNRVIQPFMINAAPTYVLIDQQGKIVRANAPRPSDGEIEGLIRETLSND